MKNKGWFKKGNKPTTEMRKKLSDAHKGKHHSEETKRKIAATRIGKSSWNKGKHLTEQHRKKIGDAHRGERSNWWKGGISKTRDRNKHMGRRYVNWRTKVFQRDNWICQTCGSMSGYKEAHHKKSWANFPKLRYVMSNGVTLCKTPCHVLANKEQRKLELTGADRRIRP